MEDEAKSKTTNEEIPTENQHEAKADQDREKLRIVQIRGDAGPSGSALPGTVETKGPQPKPGLSKSEHSFRQIITPKDVANALKTINGAANQGVKNIHLADIKVPILGTTDHATDNDDATTFIDLKKFMASCFKLSNENSNGVVLADIANVQNVHALSAVSNELPEICTGTIVQTENAPIHLPNEVIVTGTIEPKISRITPDKKKTSGTISERSDLGLAQRDSLSSIGSNVCRICMTRGRERLISPCNCKGSLANVHLSCLERWLNQVGRNHCELCGFSYPAIRTPRYTVLQALRLWFGNPRNRSHLQSDCLIFWLLSTVTAGLLAVCIVGTQYFVIEGNKFGKLDAGARKEEGISHRITETAMDFFMAIVLCGYSVTVYLLWKDHYVMWNRWRRANVNVRLLLSPDSNPVPFVPRPRYNVV